MSHHPSGSGVRRSTFSFLRGRAGSPPGDRVRDPHPRQGRPASRTTRAAAAGRTCASAPTARCRSERPALSGGVGILRVSSYKDNCVVGELLAELCRSA